MEKLKSSKIVFQMTTWYQNLPVRISAKRRVQSFTERGCGKPCVSLQIRSFQKEKQSRKFWECCWLPAQIGDPLRSDVSVVISRQIGHRVEKCEGGCDGAGRGITAACGSRHRRRAAHPIVLHSHGYDQEDRHCFAREASIVRHFFHDLWWKSWWKLLVKVSSVDVNKLQLGFVEEWKLQSKHRTDWLIVSKVGLFSATVKKIHRRGLSVLNSNR